MIKYCSVSCNFLIFHCSFQDVRLTSENDIPTVPFLDACRTGLQIFGECLFAVHLTIVI